MATQAIAKLDLGSYQQLGKQWGRFNAGVSADRLNNEAPLAGETGGPPLWDGKA